MLSRDKSDRLSVADAKHQELWDKWIKDNFDEKGNLKTNSELVASKSINSTSSKSDIDKTQESSFISVDYGTAETSKNVSPTSDNKNQKKLRDFSF